MEGLERGLVLAKQVLSQLSYTPTVGVPFILKHLPLFQKSNPPFSDYAEPVSKSAPRRTHSFSIFMQDAKKAVLG
jgi:hypothetical protein